MPYLALALLTGRIDPYVYRYCQDWIFLEPHAKASPALQLMAKANLPRGIRTLEAGSRMLVADFLAEASRQKFISRLNNLALSTLILWGRHDGMLPVANAYAGARRIPSAKLHIFENSAHMPMLEEPESFNSVIQNFLNTKTSRGRQTRHGKKAG
jgi:pimeloyl-ACP methyl ester carboxylesterase